MQMKNLVGEWSSMRLSELSGKEVVDIEKAEKMGALGYMDLEINEKDGQIQTLIIPVGKWEVLKGTTRSKGGMESNKESRTRYASL